MTKKTLFEQWLDKNNDLFGKSIILLEMVYNAGYESAIRYQASCTEVLVKDCDESTRR